MFKDILLEYENAVDDEGAKGCYKKTLIAFSKHSGINKNGLWVAVDGFLQGWDMKKMVKRLQKSWGGTPEQWLAWIKIMQNRPDC